MKNDEFVILVDCYDNAIGVVEKLEAHRTGQLHRAFSIFLFSSDGRLLMQQRARSKYHSPLLWSNTVCSHPRVEEDVMSAGKRRLQEEMRISAELRLAFEFTYKADVGNGLIEHEYDHVLFGTFDGTPDFNSDEVEDYRFMTTHELSMDLLSNPESYSPWFRIAYPRVLSCYNQNNT